MARRRKKSLLAFLVFSALHLVRSRVISCVKLATSLTSIDYLQSGNGQTPHKERRWDWNIQPWRHKTPMVFPANSHHQLVCESMHVYTEPLCKELGDRINTETEYLIKKWKTLNPFTKCEKSVLYHPFIYKWLSVSLVVLYKLLRNPQLY